MKWLQSFNEKQLRLFSLALLGGIALALVGGIFTLHRLNSQYSMRQFMPADHPLYKNDREIKSAFRLTQEEPIIVNLKLNPGTPGTWLEPARIALIERATAAVAAIDGIQGVTSIANVQTAGDRGKGIEVENVLKFTDPARWKERVLSDPVLAPGLISVDGQVITLIAQINILPENQIRDIVSRIRAEVSAIANETGAHASVSGVVTLQNDMASLVNKELQRFFVFAFLACLVTLVAYFRSFSTVVVCMILVFIANIATLSCLAISGIPFSILSSTLPILCSIEALAIGSHTLLIFSDNYRHAVSVNPGVSKAEVIWSSYKALLFPNYLMSSTTIIGFATLVTSTVPLIRQFAYSVSGGILVSCICMSIALPPLMYLFPVPVARKFTASKARWALWVIQQRRFVVMAAAVLVAVFLIHGMRLNWAVRLYDDLPIAGGIKTSADLIDQNLGGMIPLNLMVKVSGETDPWHEPARIEKVRELLDRWRKDSNVGSAIGLPDLLHTGIQKADSRRSIAEILFLYSFSGADNPTSGFLSGDGASTRLSFRMKDVPADQMKEVVRRIESDVQEAFPDAEVKAGGMAVMVHPLNAELSSDLIFGLWHSLLLISVLLVLVFRSVRLAIVAAVPNLLPPLVLLATMAILRTPVKPVVAIIFSIALGLAYNNTVFLMTRMRKLQLRFGEAADVILRTWYQEGNPCLFSSLAVIGGFAIFLSSYFSPNRTFGAYMLWSIGVGIVGDLVVLPALVSMFPWLLFPEHSGGGQLAVAGSGHGSSRKNAALFGVMVLGLVGPSAAAAAENVVHTPFAMQFDQQNFNTLFFDGVITRALNGTSNSVIPDIVETQPFTVRVSGLHLNVTYSFTAPHKRAGGWDVRSRSVGAELVIGRVDASQIIQEVHNGTIVDVEVTGICTNVRLVLPPQQGEASGKLVLTQNQGHPRLVLQDFQANWKPGSWKVVSMDCSGSAQGFDKVVAKTATERLQKVDPFLSTIEAAVQAGLDEGVSGPIVLEMKNPLDPSHQLKLNAPPARTDGSGDVQVQGDAYFYFTGGKGGCGADIRGFPSEPQLKAKDNALIVPLAALKALLACAHSDGSLARDSDSRSFPAFQELQQNTFEKMAVWPDLNHFANNAIFRFHARTSKAPDISGERATGPHQFSATLAQQVYIDLRAPVQGGYVPYMRVTAGYQGPVYVSVNKGKISFRGDPKAPFGMNGAFFQSYVDHYQCDTRVDWATISPKAGQGLLSSPIEMALPSYAINPSLKVQVINGDLQGSNFRFGLQLVQK